jgi:hypothetical protein
MPVKPDIKIYGTCKISVTKNGLRIWGSNSRLVPFFNTRYSKNILIRNENINVIKNFADIKNPIIG